jgi:hypothetical protein
MCYYYISRFPELQIQMYVRHYGIFHWWQGHSQPQARPAMARGMEANFFVTVAIVITVCIV